jgi:hypothetical protein
LKGRTFGLLVTLPSEVGEIFERLIFGWGVLILESFGTFQNAHPFKTHIVFLMKR